MNNNRSRFPQRFPSRFINLNDIFVTFTQGGLRAHLSNVGPPDFEMECVMDVDPHSVSRPVSSASCAQQRVRLCEKLFLLDSPGT